MPVKPIPDGYHSVTPVIMVNGAARLHDFLKKVFDAKKLMLYPGPNNTVVHSEVQIGDSRVMVADANAMFPAQAGSYYVYVSDVDAAYKRALVAGAKSEREPSDQFYGDRNATVIDEFGNRWSMAKHVEDVSEEEMTRRMHAMSAK
jgi:uncharacterized glyoxalase superfamily protein PhnB